jgi:hypothetical protein
MAGRCYLLGMDVSVLPVEMRQTNVQILVWSSENMQYTAVSRVDLDLYKKK